MKSKAMERAHWRAKQYPRPRYRRLHSPVFARTFTAFWAPRTWGLDALTDEQRAFVGHVLFGE